MVYPSFPFRPSGRSFLVFSPRCPRFCSQRFPCMSRRSFPPRASSPVVSPLPSASPIHVASPVDSGTVLPLLSPRLFDVPSAALLPALSSLPLEIFSLKFAARDRVLREPQFASLHACNCAFLPETCKSPPPPLLLQLRSFCSIL